MTIVEWLERGRNIDKEIKSLERAQQHAYDRATSATTNPAAEKVQTSPRNNAENSFITYASYSEMIDNRIKELYAIKQEILEAVNALDDATLRTILIEKFINFRTWSRIAADMNYSKVHLIHNLYPKALKEISKRVNCI